MSNQVGDLTFRKENIAREVTGFALQEFKIRPLLMESASSANQESYFQESSTELTASGQDSIQGTPRLAPFANVRVTETKKSAYMIKFAASATISIEDKWFNNLDLMARTELRIARALANQEDTYLWGIISENQSATNINSYSISAGNEWDSSTIQNRDPIYDISRAISAIAQQNYPIRNGNGFLLVNDTDYVNIVTNAKVSNNPSYQALSNLTNGQVANLLNLRVITSEVVTADYALVGLAKECGTWKSGSPLQVATIYDEGIKWEIRAWEFGMAQLTNPKAITLIDNTRA